MPKEGSPAPFGHNLAPIRREKGFTQEVLVQKSRVVLAPLRCYEVDKPSPILQMLIRLATALGVSIDALALFRQRHQDAPSTTSQFQHLRFWKRNSPR